MNETKRKHVADLAAGAFMIVMSAVVYLDVANTKIIARNDRITVTFFPRLLAVMIVCLSLIVIGQALLGLGKPAAADAAERDGGGKSLPSAIATLVCLGVYVSLIDFLGFLLATAGYVFAQAWIMAPDAKRRAGPIALLAVCAAIGVYAVFKYGFKLMVPEGLLG